MLRFLNVSKAMLYLGYVSAYKFNAEKISHLTTSHFFISFFLENSNYLRIEDQDDYGYT